VATLRFLHLHSSFDAGGKELRCARLINAFGPGIEHAIVSGQPAALGAGALISHAIPTEYPPDFPPLAGFPWFKRLARIAVRMKEFDLVLTYNWGAMDAVMAHTLYAQLMQLPPLVHHEDGFNQDEARRLSRRRNWYRRFALDRADALVVPSRRLEAIALDAWRQPRAKVHRIPNGIDTGAFAGPPRSDAVPGMVKREGDLWVGTLAGLRAVKNLRRMVRAFAGLPDAWQLVILGEGPERAAIEREAAAAGIADRVHLPGFVARPEAVAGLFDVFALSSDSEQFPVSVLQAMAAGLPVAAPAVGDIAAMVAPENAQFIVPPGDEAALAGALASLAADSALRRTVGAANRARAQAEFDEARMIARYRALYATAMGRADLP
jgi:glycosyltransferase involved in cell wall biosynthesis